MKVNVHTHKIIKIYINYNDVSELLKVQELYFKVLQKVFFNKPALLITIAPDKKYSVGYEFGSFQELKFEKSKILINNINSCSSSLLKEISQSEEFSRGLLLLMTTNKVLLESMNKNIGYIVNRNGIENLSSETIICENDGNTLCLYNTDIESSALYEIVGNISI